MMNSSVRQSRHIPPHSYARTRNTHGHPLHLRLLVTGCFGVVTSGPSEVPVTSLYLALKVVRYFFLVSNFNQEIIDLWWSHRSQYRASTESICSTPLEAMRDKHALSSKHKSVSPCLEYPLLLLVASFPPVSTLLVS